ncbi:ABC transporter substrate-binding protein [Burkholderia dolosa]|uniref:ABC transporter substrate-binding protein n=1 Tax=Burkholderia dolosa TaxID=152500 RepID=UPI001B9C2C03|nr:ABC transporter substrate-binding protein [Burkholderia dolosa]MBR8301254.1 ABC transporter substrate-binding protein [Burkholderia dolosa]MBY4829132.1 ABC transporter substrate-binding protein [Burkholderia dolosa]
MNTTLRTLRVLAASLALAAAGAADAETIRVAIGTQDTTINCATGGLLIRELHLLDKYLPRTGKYRDVRYDVQWKDFTSGAPLTNEMVAGKLDFGAMADFPGALNGAAFRKAGRASVFIAVLDGSIDGSGNGIVVPSNSPVRSLADLKGRTISVPFASTAHGMLLRAIKAQGWNPDTDVNIVTQAPEVAGSALKANKIDAHADFVPFADLFPYRRIARKIYDGAQTHAPTFHGALVDADYAQRYPEVVVAYLRAAIDANRLLAQDPEKYSLLIEKVTGIDAPVDYLYHGPLGIQTRDFTWKPEYRQAVATAIDTLKLLKKTDTAPDPATFVDDRYIRAAFAASGLDYDAALKRYGRQPLVANDASTGKPIRDFNDVAQVWPAGDEAVRHYANPASAFAALAKLGPSAKVRTVFVHDHASGLKLFADQAWYVKDAHGALTAFLLKSDAHAYAQRVAGAVVDYAAARTVSTPALAAR